jgi:hypothetical protein
LECGEYEDMREVEAFDEVVAERRYENGPWMKPAEVHD